METRPTLAYADSPARDRLSVERDRGCARIVVPAARDWRLLGGGLKVGAVLLGFVVIACVMSGFRAWGTDESQPLFINGGIYAIFLGILIASAHQSLYRSFIFELTGDALVITCITPGGLRSTRRWRRRLIGAVNVAVDGPKLAIHITGRDLLVLFIGTRGVTEAVARALNEALDAEPASNGAASDEPEAADALPPGHTRTLLLRIAAAIGVFALGSALVYGLAVAFYVALLAAIPAGIALGTQDKEFYF